MREVKILGEDKCHIVLIEALLQNLRVRIKPKRVNCKGSVLPWLKKQVTDDTIYFDAEIILVDEDRKRIDLEETERRSRKLKWESRVITLEPKNCEGVLLSWIDQDFQDPKADFRKIQEKYDYPDPGAFIRYIVSEIADLNEPPEPIKKIVDFLVKLKKQE